MSKKGLIITIVMACGGAATVTELLPTVWASDAIPAAAAERTLARMSVAGVDLQPLVFGPVHALSPVPTSLALRREFGPYGPLMSNPPPQAPALPAHGGNVQLSYLDR